MSWTKSIGSKGEYQRKDSIFRNWIKSSGKYPPAKDRYHLYICYACRMLS